jgi:hypothetical protein
MDIQRIVINKNRGWRGLAEVRCLNKENKSELEMIFSFSQPVWDDMQMGRMVLQDGEDYIIVHFDNTEVLPKGQRSVLLKNFSGNVIDTIRVPKTEIISADLGSIDYNAVIHFKKNRNNHTTSDWNCIGIRVIPEI